MTSKDNPLPLVGIQSYKGGVGKSTVAALTAMSLARQGRIVCLLDLDLLAAGLHHLLGLPGRNGAIVDFLLEGRDERSGPLAAKDVCHTICPSLLGECDTPLYMVFGRADIEDARAMVGYLLAEERAGLLQARLEVLLEELRSVFGIELFVLDCPPALFGMSAAARALVKEHRGVMLHVAGPTRQDLEGSRMMLNELSPPEERGGWTEVFMLNRCPAAFRRGKGKIKLNVARALARVDDPTGMDSGHIGLILNWLESLEVAELPDDPKVDLLARVAGDEEPDPVFDDKLQEMVSRLVELAWSRTRHEDPS